jgi:UDPglucose--hexose-1-phosphate uridylyltransferase
VHVCAARLADGREIVYYDADGDGPLPGRAVPDLRRLPAAATAAQLRRDPLLDEWVAVAAHRAGRTHLPAVRDCPLCPSRDGRHTEIPAPDYQVAVFENRFPALAGDAGRCEVVCFTSEHAAAFAALPPGRVRLVIDALADRTATLAALPHVEQVYCFENRGPEIGVTLHHPHGQIYALPFVAPRTERMLAVARAHRERTGGDLFADVLAAELAGPRVVAAASGWTAFVPAAARWPVEVHVVPHRPVPDLPALTGAERDELALLWLDVLARLDALYGAPLPYVAAWHQAPVRAGRDLARLYLQLFSVRRAAGKLKFLAGTEAGLGVFSNDVLPEDCARRLRAAPARRPSGAAPDWLSGGAPVWPSGGLPGGPFGGVAVWPSGGLPGCSFGGVPGRPSGGGAR